jgi:hypothetical protein
MAVASYFAFQKFFNHENTGSFANQFLHKYQTELDTNETNHDFQYIKSTSTLQACGGVSRNRDFYIELTNQALGVTEFTTSFFTMDLNFDISFGTNDLPLEPECKPDCLPNLGVENKAILWEYFFCINVAKNQYIFIGFKNATDCIQFIELQVNEVPVTDTMVEGYTLV